jgi:TRAP-type C4-dicarboxylate transport system permease small subunit
MLKIFSILERTVNVICALLVAFLTIVVGTEVISRYFFGFPITITTELTGITFPWIVALAATTITMHDENISLLFVKERFKGRPRFILEMFLQVLSILFCVFMVKASFDLSVALSSQRMALLRFSKAALYSSVLFSFSAITMILVYKLFILIKQYGEVQK